MNELTCKELVELVTDYFENVMSAEERARLEAHLAKCDGCDRYVDQMRQTIADLGALREQDISPEAEAALLQVFREWQQATS
jgi:anti-sigma factor RsiW